MTKAVDSLLPPTGEGVERKGLWDGCKKKAAKPLNGQFHQDPFRPCRKPVSPQKEHTMQTKIRHQPIDLSDSVYITGMSIMVALGLFDNQQRVAAAEKAVQKTVLAAKYADNTFSVKDAK